MNIIKSLQARIADRLTETASPCKMYKKLSVAEYHGNKMSEEIRGYFGADEPCRFVIVEFTNRAGEKVYTPCFDYTELLRRPETTGGYLGFAEGFYTY
jgi:hypothetical protein